MGAFGQAYTWEDGVSATISKPKKFTPSDTAAGADEKDNVSFTITVVNGTESPLELTLAMVSVQSGNTEASQIFDTAKGIEGSPMTKVLPGRESEFTVAFSVADPDDLVVEFTPGFEYSSVLFSS